MEIQGSTAGEIADSVRTLAAGGRLGAGDALPSIRDLAVRLGLNRNTVAAAYAQLAAAGVVESRRRGGTIIRPVPDVPGEGRAAGRELINLAAGNPDPALLPAAGPIALDGYTTAVYGHPPIGEALAAWSARHHAPDVDAPHRLVLTHGTVDAFERLFGAHLTRGDRVAVEDPGYISAIGTLRLNGYRAEPVPADDEGMTPDGLRSVLSRGVRAVLGTARAQNPTGAGFSASRAADLRDVLAAHPGVLVVEDDHFSAVSSQPYHRITPPDAPRHALIRSVSKFLGPDLRLAFVLADPDTAARLEARLGAPTWVSHLLQHVTATLLPSPLIPAARAAYATRVRLLTDALSAQGIPVNPRTDGLNVWVPLPSHPGPASSATRVIAGLADRGWAVRSGADFAVTGRPHPAVRVTTSTITAGQATRFAADLAALL
ncbi:aminotransferase class I/II-fold pyridoxal phosphate-dependent enzyme [Actinoplanes sp. NPDC051851]|uniref:aminotransferase class I/II-fold pyridoxal phosphate-dependent enzyme n=1 Tax=Actinoplanes sp. NPDC051851 TaxID=3154753 RepID=UPI00344806C4